MDILAGARRSSALVLLLSSLTSASLGCSHAAKLEKASLDRHEEVLLEIANHNWLDVIIYVLHDGQPTRVGIANASSSVSFSLPHRLLGQGGEIRLIGDPIGGARSVITETVVVQPGQYVEWTLESNLDRSAIGVY